MGAMCRHCNQNMTVAASCVPLSFVVDGDYVPALRYGMEEGHRAWNLSGERCHDCGVAIGGYHHPGCDVERHPITNEQAMLGGFTRRTPSGELVEL
jgi:hypothetical protein